MFWELSIFISIYNSGVRIFFFFIFSNVSIDGTADTKSIGMFSKDALEIAISRAL